MQTLDTSTLTEQLQTGIRERNERDEERRNWSAILVSIVVGVIVGTLFGLAEALR